MQIVDAYLNPILDDALKKHKIEAHSKGYTDNKEEIEDDETLLDHLIKSTTGRISFSPLIHCDLQSSKIAAFFTMRYSTFLLQDEVCY